MKFKLKIVFILCLMVISFSNLYGQRKPKGTLDFGLYIGASNYTGELTKTIFPVMKETKFCGGMLARYNLSPWVTLKATGTWGRISGADANFKDDAFRKTRNLSFRSDLIEFTFQGEWNILGYENTRTSYGWTPYLFGGISVFKFNPKAKFIYMPNILKLDGSQYHDPSLKDQDGKWIELQPLSTEGQQTTKYNERRQYSLTQFSIPMGAGFKFALDDQWAMGIEIGMRKTFTDYLDDISKTYVEEDIVGGSNGYMSRAMRDRSPETGAQQFSPRTKRGNEKTDDWYMIGGITITYRIFGNAGPCFNF